MQIGVDYDFVSTFSETNYVQFYENEPSDASVFAKILDLGNIGMIIMFLQTFNDLWSFEEVRDLPTQWSSTVGFINSWVH